MVLGNHPFVTLMPTTNKMNFYRLYCSFMFTSKPQAWVGMLNLRLAISLFQLASTQING